MTLDYEKPLWEQSVSPIGVDEAGRGALAGPVVAAAVILHQDGIPMGLNDSKKLSPNQRERLKGQILNSAVSWAVGIIDAQRIDTINILQATFEAMHLAINECICNVGNVESVHLLVDGNRFARHEQPHTTIIRGDGISPSIAAASILAKKPRDHLMKHRVHETYPNYGFDVHKGYGTARHRAAIIQHGACTEHRLSFLSNILPASA